MARWLVRYSVTTPFWFYAAHITFREGDTAEAVTEATETTSTPETRVRVVDVTLATRESERRHMERVEARKEWLRRAKTGDAYRGLL